MPADLSTRTREFGLLTADEAARLPSRAVLLLPIGSLEPHGHLPLATDSMIAGAVLERVARATADTWLLPTLPLGYLFKYHGWPGAVGIGAAAVEEQVLGVCRAAAGLSVRRVFVMSGHDENREAVIGALRGARLETGVAGVYCDWIDLAVSLVARLSTSRREGHASEIQTSVIQYLFPGLLTGALPTGEEAPPEPETGADDLFAPSEQGTWVRPVPRSTGRSYTGDPSVASPEKGRAVVEHIVRRAAEVVEALQAEPL
ncbi:MAG TPA: creatininase family protein [Longimicrobiaceae bacterium]|nr:creatininase family protein [Longimicrobiaceae bacterium]